MSNYVFAASEAEMTVKPEENKTANIVNIENIDNNTGVNQAPSTKIYGTTLVNLLGKYGNFEVDSNLDGLADGWTNDATLAAVTNAIDTNKLFGSKCQKITLAADGEGGNYTEVDVTAGEVLFVAGYIKALDTSTTGKLIVDWRDATNIQISTDIVGTNATTSYVRQSASLTAPANAVKARIYTTVSGITGKLAYFDGIEVVNLTTQGVLDSVRATKYAVAHWGDLTEAQLEAEIPYFDSVLSVNVENGTASELTVENRGKNLLGIQVINHNQCYYSEENGIIRITNFLSPYTKVVSMLFDFNLQAGTTVTLSAKVRSISGTAARISIGEFNTVSDYATPFGVSSSSNDTNEWITLSVPYTIARLYPILGLSLFAGGDTINQGIAEFKEIQVEIGSSATDYVPPREDSITIPDTVELHGFDGVFNYIDSNGNYTKNWEREDKTTDVSGAFSLSGYATGSKVICRNKTNGEVEVLDAAASVTTSWTQTEIEILYRLATAVESTVQLESTGFMLYPGDNNVLSPDSKAPAAIQLSGYTGVSSTSSTQVFIERFRANTKRGGRIYQPYGSRTLKSVPTTEEVAISLSKMNIDDETIGLALENIHFQLENTYTNENNGSTITDTYQHCRITSHGKEYSAGDIVKEDVEIECAKVVTS